MKGGKGPGGDGVLRTGILVAMAAYDCLTFCLELVVNLVVVWLIDLRPGA